MKQQMKSNQINSSLNSMIEKMHTRRDSDLKNILKTKNKKIVTIRQDNDPSSPASIMSERIFRG